MEEISGSYPSNRGSSKNGLYQYNVFKSVQELGIQTLGFQFLVGNKDTRTHSRKDTHRL